MTARRSAIQPDQLANCRPGVSPGRRFALALGLTLALFGSAGSASADSASAPMVSATIYASGGGTSTSSVSTSQLLADTQNCPAYSQTEMNEYDSSGSTSVGLPHENGSGTGTWPMSTILHCLQNPVSVGDVTGITVVNVNGSLEVASGSQLAPADLASPSDFQPTTDSPVVSDLGSSFQYNRPWRGQGDLNASDQVTSSDPISIEVFEGPPLTVNASASPSRPAAGSRVSFSATVTGNKNSALTYHWSFGDNLPDSDDAGPSVTYTDGGNYTVTLQVTDTDGGAGGTTVPITVTGSSSSTPPAATTSTPETNTGPAGTGTNPDGGAHGTTGGNGKGNGKQPSSGNGNGTRSGKPSQNQTGASSPSSSRRQKPSGSGTGPSGGSGGPSGGSGRPSSGSGRASSGSGGSSGGSGGSSGGRGAGGSGPATAATPSSSIPRHDSTPGGRHVSHRTPTHNRPSSTTAEPGQLVTGRLVADVTPLSAGASPLVQRSPGSAAAASSRPKPTRNSPLAVIGGCLAIVLLLGLGARRELRGPGWWRTLRFSS